MNPSSLSLQKERKDTLPLETIQKGRIIGQGNIGLETSMGKLQIEDRRQQEVVEDPKKEESPLALPPSQQVQGESSQDLPKDWKCFINHPSNPSSGVRTRSSLRNICNNLAFTLKLNLKI